MFSVSHLISLAQLLNGVYNGTCRSDDHSLLDEVVTLLMELQDVMSDGKIDAIEVSRISRQIQLLLDKFGGPNRA